MYIYVHIIYALMYTLMYTYIYTHMNDINVNVFNGYINTCTNIYIIKIHICIYVYTYI